MAKKQINLTYSDVSLDTIIKINNIIGGFIR